VSEEFNPLNPWGSPGERSLNSKTVDLLLRLVDSGRGLASLMDPTDPKRRVRLEKLWTHHRRAESMILNELGRHRRIQRKQAEEVARLEEGLPIVDEDDDEDEEEDDYLTF
jgi:hypothetical protein